VTDIDDLPDHQNISELKRPPPEAA